MPIVELASTILALCSSDGYNMHCYPCAVCAKVMRLRPSVYICAYVCCQKTRLFASCSSKISTITLSAAS